MNRLRCLFSLRVSFLRTLLYAGLSGSPAYARIPMDAVFVGNPMNAADGTSFGSVFHDHLTGTCEVTNGQYAAFPNAVASTDKHGLYGSEVSAHRCGRINRSGSAGYFRYSVKSGLGDKLVNYLGFGDAAGFTRKLNYRITGLFSGIFN